MLGAIIGDIIGSRFEFDNIKTKDFELFTKECNYTDDTVMTLAVAKALVDCKEDYSDLSEKAIYWMQKLGRKRLYCGFGAKFYNWIQQDDPKPYESFGNGAAMRVSPVGLVAKTFEEIDDLSEAVTKVSHNHPEGLKGAEAVASCVYHAKNGYSKEEIRQMVNEIYYELDIDVDEIRKINKFNETCQHTVPLAIECFLESKDFEDAIRIAVSLGGDSDTIAAITGSIAGAFYGIPEDIKQTALSYLDDELLDIVEEFENKFLK